MSLSAESAGVLPSASRTMAAPVARVKSTPALRGANGYASPSLSAARLIQSVDEEERDAAEIRSIMQHGLGLDTPPTTFLGVSPPRRSTGAANPLVQDWNWQSNAYVGSHFNLQALREIDARGVSFLRMNGCTGENQLLVESPDTAQLAGASDSSAASHYAASFPPPKVSERCMSKPCTRVMAKPATCQVGFNVA